MLQKHDTTYIRRCRPTCYSDGWVIIACTTAIRLHLLKKCPACIQRIVCTIADIQYNALYVAFAGGQYLRFSQITRHLLSGVARSLSGKAAALPMCALPLPPKRR